MATDDDEIAFHISIAPSGVEYQLTVSCKEGLTEGEFADALRSFADDVDNGVLEQAAREKDGGKH